MKTPDSKYREIARSLCFLASNSSADTRYIVESEIEDAIRAVAEESRREAIEVIMGLLDVSRELANDYELGDKGYVYWSYRARALAKSK